MTKFIFIRHGEPRYDEVVERGFKNQGYDLGKLTERGVNQAEVVSKDPRLNGAEVIVSSPYTRALQTAAIISKNTQINLNVETDLHEWMPDTTFSDRNDLDKAYPEFMREKGKRHANTVFHFESMDEVVRRTRKALKPYLIYDKVIVVCHGIVISSFTHIEDMIEHCGIREMDLDESFFK
ncbi:MAG: histidine phosphatase family protein [Acholeplasma sp.]|nr:histidine phosphatase family protein [Acholeplasma sp.]